MTGTILATRTADGTGETDELERLAEIAGYDVLGTVTATGPRDATYNLTPGAVTDLEARVRETGATRVVVDNDLTPGQAHNIATRLPDEVELMDRRRLVLTVFEQGAGSKVARLQVRLARLEYELPRLRAAINRDEATEITRHDEEGKPIEDHKRRIDATKQRLAQLSDPTADRLARRAKAGFDTVALVGYTNAGKTTLLRRLADELGLDSDHHDDESGEPTVRDQLFETLNTTTRRATCSGRRLLLTDTVGFVSGLPHEFVAAFESTMASARHAELVLLVVDGSDPRADIERKLTVAKEQLTDADGTVLPVVNKVDRIDDSKRAEIVELFETPPVWVSATDGSLDALRVAIADALPTAETTLTVPNSDDAMTLVSWCYDHAEVREIQYGDEIAIRVAGKPSVIEEAERKATNVELPVQ